MTAPLERDFYNTILEGIHALGWKGVHFRPARTVHGWRTAVQGDGKGWPDWVLWHPRDGVVFVEVKRDGSGLDADQRRCRDELVAAGATHITLLVPSGLSQFWETLSDRTRPRTGMHPLVRAMIDAEDEDRRTR